MQNARESSFSFATRVLPALTEQEQRQFLKSGENDFHETLASVLYVWKKDREERGRVKNSAVSMAELSVPWLVNGKGLGHDAVAHQNVIARDLGDPRLSKQVARLRDVQRKLSSLAMTSAKLIEKQERDSTIAKLATEEQALAKEIALATGTANQAAIWIDLPKFQAAIPEDTVFIDIARFRTTNYKYDGGLNEELFPFHYAAWITPGARGEPTVVDLGTADEIDRLVEAIRKSIESDGAAGGAISEKGEVESLHILNNDLHKLATKILDPLAAPLENAKRIILSPDGALWLAPWAALPIDDKDGVLIEKFSLQLVTSGRDLVQDKKTALPTTRPAIFADPHFDMTNQEKRDSLTAVFKQPPRDYDDNLRGFYTTAILPKVAQLPGTAAEAQLVVPSIEKFTGTTTQRYEGKFALEGIAKSLKRPKVAVFATHGFVLPNPIEIANSWLPELRNPSGSGDANATPMANPLFRCGLLLSGCNRRDGAVGIDDGILTGMEITAIDFRGTELVVLSACETGVGDVRNGEGVASLRQAFQLAGAKSVVASLWKVPDRDSALIMNDFFANIVLGQSPTDAMRQAQLKRIASRKERYGAAHPLFWAAWTVSE